MQTSDPTYALPLPEHLDFEALRARALVQLQRMTGHRWTDHNTHDPGITLLEALCYALTDLGYRAARPVEDWLAEAEALSDLPGPEVALSTPPVSAADWQALLAAEIGSGHARLETLGENDSNTPILRFYPEAEGGGALSTETDPDAQAVPLRGLLRPIGQAAPEGMRGLCTDFLPPSALGADAIEVHLALELAPETQGQAALDKLWRDLRSALRAVIEKPVGRRSRAEALVSGQPVETVLEGPLLPSGLANEGSENAEANPTARKALYASDLVAAVMRAGGVRVVRTIELKRGNEASPWLLPLRPGQSPRLGLLRLQLFRAGVPLAWEPPLEGETPALPSPLIPPATSAVAAKPRQRNLGRYHSIRYHLPAVYGLFEGDGAERPARVKQLSAYLLFFEQILAGSYAALPQTARWFSPSADDWGRPDFQPLRDLPTAAAVWQTPSPDRDADLAGAWESPAQHQAHGLRLLDHWLARFGEQLPETETAQTTALRTRRDFWQNWPAHSARRGLGFDKSRPEMPGGLEARIAALLGLTEEEQFCLVEHILLRPIPNVDVPDERGHLLTHVPRPDPFSLQATLVYPRNAGRFAPPSGGLGESEFAQTFRRVARLEAPAHIQLHFLALENEAMAAFRLACQNWRHALSAEQPAPFHRLRIRRDAVLDQLFEAAEDPGVSLPRFFIGWPVPILDLEPAPVPMVVTGGIAEIRLPDVQPGIEYRLCDRDGEPLTDIAAQTANAAGDPLVFRPRFDAEQGDTTFRILARKTLPGNPAETREGLLRRRIYVRVGIRVTGLGISPSPDEIDFDTQGRVVITESQAETTYALVSENGTPRSAHYLGDTARPITLETTDRLEENATFYIQAWRTGRPETAVRVPEPVEIRVRPNPALRVALAAPPGPAYDTPSTLLVRSAQAGVSYRVFYREIGDAEFDHRQPSASSGRLRIELSDGLVPVSLDLASALPNPPNAAPMPGWTALDPVVAAAGDDLALPLPALREDVWLRVQAIKQGIVQTVFLHEMTAALVLPNVPEIRLSVATLAEGTSLRAEIDAPQPGVSYQWFAAGGTQALGQAVYFHDRTPGSIRFDGLGPLPVVRASGMKVGVDFVVGPVAASNPLMVESGILPNASVPIQLFATKIQTKRRVLLQDWNG